MIFIDYCSGGLVFQIFVKIHWKLRTKQMSLLFFKYICKKISYLYESLNLGTSRKCICGHFIACVHIYTSCMHVRAWIFTKNFELVCYCLILSALGYNFIRMQFFISEIFAQEYWHLFALFFSQSLCFSPNLSERLQAMYERI